MFGSRRLLSQGAIARNTAEAVERIETRHHILPPEYVRLVGRQAIGRPSPGGAPDWDVAALLKVMEENGIGAAVVSVSAIGGWSKTVEYQHGTW